MLSEFDSFLSVLHNHSFTFDLSTHFILNLGAAPSVYCTCFFCCCWLPHRLTYVCHLNNYCKLSQYITIKHTL